MNNPLINIPCTYYAMPIAPEHTGAERGRSQGLVKCITGLILDYAENPEYSRHVKTKLQAPAVSWGAIKSGLWRSGSNVTHLYPLFCLDIDKNNIPEQQLRDTFAKFGIACIYYTTASSKPDNRKWRVVVRLSRSLEIDEWTNHSESFVREVYRFFDIEGDEVVKDLPRIFFLPVPSITDDFICGIVDGSNALDTNHILEKAIKNNKKSNKPVVTSDDGYISINADGFKDFTDIAYRELKGKNLAILVDSLMVLISNTPYIDQRQWVTLVSAYGRYVDSVTLKALIEYWIDERGDEFLGKTDFDNGKLERRLQQNIKGLTKYQLSTAGFGSIHHYCANKDIANTELKKIRDMMYRQYLPDIPKRPPLPACDPERPEWQRIAHEIGEMLKHIDVSNKDKIGGALKNIFSGTNLGVDLFINWCNDNVITGSGNYGLGTIIYLCDCHAVKTAAKRSIQWQLNKIKEIDNG